MDLLLDTFPADSLVVLDMAILLGSRLGRELPSGRSYDTVVVVEAPLEIRIERLTTQRGMSEADARARIASQPSDAERRAIADFVIINDGDIAELDNEVDRLVAWLTVEVKVIRSENLSAEVAGSIRSLMDAAFDDFADEDWDHALGGWHVIATDGDVVAHASVVERWLCVGGELVRVGYVEAVATSPLRQRRGWGTAVMRKIDIIIAAEFDMGALSTSAHDFYERLGWERWRGPSFVRNGGAVIRSADEDDGIMILRCASTAGVDLSLPASCEARSGDDW
jgi:aminoglycoside 2'-N-acetyltransferase I